MKRVALFGTEKQVGFHDRAEVFVEMAKSLLAGPLRARNRGKGKSSG